MKRTFRNLSSFLLALVMILNLSVTVFAAESSVTYEGGAEKFVFLQGSEYTDTDLFGDDFKDVMPGDTVTEKITVKNNYKGSDYVKIYMRAAAHDENGNPLTYSEVYENTDGKDQAGIEEQRDETVVTMTDFLSKLSMTVKQGDKVLFEASPDELDGLKDNVLIAKLGKGASTELTVELNVPIELGNEYANRVGEVDWVFVVEERNNPSNPEEPEEPEIYPYVPVITAPTKTGDNANIAVWVTVLVAAVAAAAGIAKKRKQKMGKN